MTSTATRLNPDTIDRSAHLRRARATAAKALRSHLRLPPQLTISEWADHHRYLSPPAALPGPWKTSRVPYLREIQDTISGTEYQDITIIKCAQSGGTEALNNAVGYYIDQEPTAILVIQPNVKPMAEDWSKDRLAPMLRDCPRLRGKVRDPKSRDTGNTILHKTFLGGHITVIGANSASGLAGRPIRVVLADELDRWGASAGTEGDPLSLAEERTTTYQHRKKIVKVSTPGNEGESRVEKEWPLTDQRHYYVPCPSCGEFQPLEWRDSQGSPGILAAKGPFRLIWEKSQENGEEIHHSETTRYQCRACQTLIPDTEKAGMLAHGKWVKHNPASRRAGFHISGLISPWVRWREVAEKWLKRKDDPEQRKTFFNTVLGLVYQEAGEVPDAKALAGRREHYPAEVPNGNGLLTMSIDVQGDRLECDVRGWGELEESWHIRLERFYGDPTGAKERRKDELDPWTQAEALLNRVWEREDGTTMRIASCMVDSGYLTDVVYRWVRPRQHRRVFAYKGVDNAKSPIGRASKANNDGVKVFTVNPNAFKDILFRRLRRVSPGAGYLHFGGKDQTGGDDEYLHQYGAEKRVVQFVKNIAKVSYVRVSPRNEAIDHYVLNLAAFRALGRAVGERVRSMAARQPKAEGPLEEVTQSEAPRAFNPPPDPPRRRGFVQQWRRR